MNKELSLFEKLIYRLLYTLLLTAVLLFCVSSYAGIKSLEVWHYSVALGIVCLFSVFFACRKKSRIFYGLLIGVLLASVILAVGGDTTIAFVESYFKWLTGKNGWQATWTFGYEILQTIFLTLAGCCLEMVLEKYEKLRLIFAGSMVAGLIAVMLTKTELPHAGVICAFFYPVMIGMEWIQRSWKKHKTRDTRVHTLWITPFLIAYFVAMLFMPHPEEPYDWQFVKDIYCQVQRSFSRLNDFVWSLRDEGSSVAFAGFSEDARLVGGVSSENAREIMTINSQVQLKTNLYLSGKAFDTFDGTRWIHTDEKSSVMRVGESDTFEETIIYADTVKTVQAVETYGELSMKNYLSKTTLQFSYPKRDKEILFLPIKTEYLKEKEDSYVSVYYQMNLDAEHFYELLSQIQMENSIEEFEGQNLYSGEIVLSEDVKNYLQEITSGARNDIEKLRLIEKELSSFTYNRMPGPLPDYVVDESSFLDYFLLESKEGFCSHFATAFVLLARAEGVPARYVQGFCVQTNGEKEIVVDSGMAHAWPEVYISGVGFIPFEPTPGYGEIRYTPWEIQKEDVFDVSIGSGAEIPNQEMIPETEMPSENIADEEITSYSMNLLKKITYVLPILLLAVFSVWLLDKIREKIRYRKMTLSEKFKVHAEINFQLWKVLGIYRKPNETLEEFSFPVKQMADFEKEMIQFIVLYEDVLYGKKEVSPDMFAITKKVNGQLFAVIKRKNLVLYLFKRIQYYPYCIHCGSSKKEGVYL